MWMYAGIVSSLVRQWASDDNYSHGFFVVRLALYFCWQRRGVLKAARPQPSIIGLILITVSLAILLGGLLGAELFLTRISLIGVVAGVVLYVWGWQHFRTLAFPIAFLLLMIPLPTIVFNQIAFPLQLLASRAGEAVISLAGIPVLREGNVLQLPSRTLEVAEASHPEERVPHDQERPPVAEHVQGSADPAVHALEALPPHARESIRIWLHEATERAIPPGTWASVSAS